MRAHLRPTARSTMPVPSILVTQQEGIDRSGQDAQLRCPSRDARCAPGKTVAGRWSGVVDGVSIATPSPVQDGLAVKKLAAPGTVRKRVLRYRVPMANLLQELRDPPLGPVAAMVAYLGAHARPREVVVTTYEELALRFHTGFSGLRRRNGPASRRNDPGYLGLAKARQGNVSCLRPAVEWTEPEPASDRYRRIELNVVDRIWENREDPEEHVFSNPGPPGLGVVLYRAIE